MKKLLIILAIIWAIPVGGQVQVQGSIEHMTISSGGEFHCLASGGSGDYLYILSGTYVTRYSTTGHEVNLPAGIYNWCVEEYVFNPLTLQLDTIYHGYPPFEILYVSGLQKKKIYFKHKHSLGSFGFKPKQRN